MVVRSNPSGREVWSSLDETTPTTLGTWESVNLMRAQYYLTSQFEEMLEIILVSTDDNSSAAVTGAVDRVGVQFCLPCDFEELQNATLFSLSYVNQTRIYLRQPMNLTVQVYDEIFKTKLILVSPSIALSPGSTQLLVFHVNQ